MTTHQLKVQTPSPQEFVDWVLEKGQFCPNSGKELLQAAMIIQELRRIVDNADKFVFFTLKGSGEKIAIRRSSINAFHLSDSSNTFIDCTSSHLLVQESFDEVCALLAAPQQESKL